MTQPDPCSVIRIAIALAALKHKPRDQSTASYLLDLQSRFPDTIKNNDHRDWRTYALELEKQLATLKAQHDADQELLLKLPTDASQAASTSDAPPPKKRSKKNPTKDQHDLEWNWDQSRADWSHFLSSQYPLSPSLIAAYASLKGALASPNVDLLPYASRLTDAILRALDTIHVFLFSAPTPSPDPQTQCTLDAPLQLKPEYINSTRIALTSPFLMYVLRTALHTLVGTAQDSTKSRRQRQRLHTATPVSTDVHAYIHKVLDRLLDCIFLALLRALAPLCSARLAPLLSVPLKKDKDRTGRSSGGKGKDRDKDKDKRTGPASVDPLPQTDVRTDVFALIGTSLEALDALPPLVSPPVPGGSGDQGGSIAGGIRDRLGLETIRELETLYAVLPPPPSTCLLPSQQPPATPPEPAPTPTPLSAPSQTQTQTHSQPQPQLQPRSQTQQRAVPESRAKRLERLTGTRAERVRALATRDAGWFLASTLNLCVTPTLPATEGHAGRPESSSGVFLKEALLDRIGKLIRSVPLGGRVSDTSPDQQSNSDTLEDHADCNATRSELAIDPVCQNMLLAICERAMGQLASP